MLFLLFMSHPESEENFYNRPEIEPQHIGGIVMIAETSDAQVAELEAPVKTAR